MFYTNRCCMMLSHPNIWLYHVLHDNLHCLVFKEHPWFSLEAFEKLFRESASIWYLSAFALSRRILNFFLKQLALHEFHRCPRCCALAVCRRLALYYTLSASMSTPFVKNLIAQFCAPLRSFKAGSLLIYKSRHAFAWRLIFHGGGTEIWTPDTAGMNRML